MSRSLSHREKILLTFLAVFLFLVGSIYFLLLPQFESYQKNVQALEDRSYMVEDLKMQIALLQVKRENYAALEEELPEPDTVSGMKSNAQVDAFVTKLALNNGLRVHSLALADSTAEGALYSRRVTVNIALEGETDDFLRFLKAVTADGTHCSVQTFSLKNISEGSFNTVLVYHMVGAFYE